MSFVRHSPDLLPRKTEPEEIGDGRNAVVYPRNKKLGEIPDILKNYEGARAYRHPRGGKGESSRWTRGITHSLFIENLDFETMVKLENSPDVALAYYTLSEKFTDLSHKDVNLFGAGTQATVVARDEDNPGEILDIVKDYEASGKVKLHEYFVGDWRRRYYTVSDMDLETLVKLQNSPDVDRAYYSLFDSIAGGFIKQMMGHEPGKQLQRRVKRGEESEEDEGAVKEETKEKETKEKAAEEKEAKKNEGPHDELVDGTKE